MVEGSLIPGTTWESRYPVSLNIGSLNFGYIPPREYYKVQEKEYFYGEDGLESDTTLQLIGSEPFGADIQD